MWDPYINSTRKHLPDADRKIVFDKFHIAKHLGEAVDLVRRRENKQLKAAGDDRLTGTRYDWLRHPARMEPTTASSRRSRQQPKNSAGFSFEGGHDGVLSLSLRAPRAETLSLVAQLGDPLPPETHARKARMIQRRFANIITYLRLRITNAASESINSKIQWVKYTARGFRSKELRHRHLLPLRRPRSHAFNPLRTRIALLSYPSTVKL